jgi:glutamyl endopeptidase
MKRLVFSTVYILGLLSYAFGQDCEPSNTIDTRQDPFKYVCYLKKFNSAGTPYTSTAFLIAPRVLLTNAHNLYNADRYEIAPGHNGQGTKLIQGDNKLVYGMISFSRSATNTFYHKDFIINENRRTKKKKRHFDYGIIILPDTSLYHRLEGYIKLAECDEVAKNGDKIIFAGYPGGISSYNFELFQKNNSGVLTGYYEDGNMISYELGTHKGASGSPILINKNGDYKAIGIHGYGSGCKNSAIKITKDVINKIAEWTSGL